MRSQNRIRKVLFGASCATLLSIAILVIVGFLGVKVEGEKEGVNINTDRICSSEEVESSGRKALEIINRRISEDKEKGNDLIYSEAREISIFFIWIPWVLAVYAFNIRTIIDASLMTVPAALLSLLSIFTLVELAIFILASNLSVLLRDVLVRKTKSKKVNDSDET